MAELDRATQIKRELFLRVLTPTKPTASVARRIVQIMIERRFAKGDVIYRQGEPADSAFFIVEGDVELRAEGEAAWPFDAGSVIGVLDANMLRPRSRTAVAVTDVIALETPMEEWREILEESPGFANATRSEIAKTLHDLVLDLAPDGGFAEPEPPDLDDPMVVEGTVVERLVALRRCRHFELASVQTLADLAARGSAVIKKRGETVSRPGNRDRVYLVLGGQVRAERRLAPLIEARFGPSDLVLGGSSLGGCMSEYAIIAESDCVLLELSRSDIDEVVEDHGELSLCIIRGMAIERDYVMRERGRRAERKATSPA